MPKSSSHRGPKRRSIGDTKAHFAESIRDAEAGLTIVLTRHGRPVAELGPCQPRMVDRAPASEVREQPVPYGTGQTPDFCSKKARQGLLRKLLEEEIWPRIPKDQRGKAPSKREREEILGFGGDGL